jgi:hypothetical protein
MHITSTQHDHLAYSAQSIRELVHEINHREDWHTSSELSDSRIATNVRDLAGIARDLATYCESIG